MLIKTKTHLDYYEKSLLYNFEYKLTGRKDPLMTLKIYIEIIKKLDLDENDIILDIGCGNGMLFHLLQIKNYKKAIGLLPTKAEQEFVSVFFKDIDSIEVIYGNATQLPLAHNSISKIVCNGVYLLLNSQEEIKKSLEEIKRVAQENALIFIGEVLIEEPLKSFNLTNLSLQLLKQELKKIISLSKTFVKCTAPLLYIPEKAFLDLAESLNLTCIESNSCHYLREDGSTFCLPNRKNYLFLNKVK